MDKKKIGIIGFGLRMGNVIQREFEFFPEFDVVAIADINQEPVRERIARELHTLDLNKIHFYEDAIEMLDNEELDGVFVATRCDLHKKFAIEVLKRNIPLFLEKPVVTELNDYYELKEAVENNTAGGITSFPLRITALVDKVKELYESGILGKLSQIQAYNNVNYGRVYYKSWYRDDSISGGLFLQKTTHDIDYIDYILGKNPVEACAMESKMIFGGDKPRNLKCEDCPEYETCYESTKVIKEQAHDDPMGEYCSYGEDVGNHDCATIIFRYDDGLHAVYTQNFVARHDAGKRGMRMIGQEATIEFDWNKDEVLIFSHTEKKVERLTVKPVSGGGHSGGDYALLKDFIALMNGDQSVNSLKDGLNSAYICIKVRESAQEHKFVSLDY